MPLEIIHNTVGAIFLVLWVYVGLIAIRERVGALRNAARLNSSADWRGERVNWGDVYRVDRPHLGEGSDRRVLKPSAELVATTAAEP